VLAVPEERNPIHSKDSKGPSGSASAIEAYPLSNNSEDDGVFSPAYKKEMGGQKRKKRKLESAIEFPKKSEKNKSIQAITRMLAEKFKK